VSIKREIGVKVRKQGSSIILATLVIAMTACASSHDDASAAADQNEVVATAVEGKVAKGGEVTNLVDENGNRIVLRAGDVLQGDTVFRKNELKPAFTEKTVLKLNAIVRRSLDAVNDYDSKIEAIRADVDAAVAADATQAMKAKAQAGLDVVDGYHDVTVKSLADLKAEGEALDARGEYYNKTIFAGMVTFVEHVENEFRSEHQKLADRLAGKTE